MPLHWFKIHRLLLTVHWGEFKPLSCLLSCTSFPILWPHTWGLVIPPHFHSVPISSFLILTPTTETQDIWFNALMQLHKLLPLSSRPFQQPFSYVSSFNVQLNHHLRWEAFSEPQTQLRSQSQCFQGPLASALLYCFTRFSLPGVQHNDWYIVCARNELQWILENSLSFSVQLLCPSKKRKEKSPNYSDDQKQRNFNVENYLHRW